MREGRSMLREGGREGERDLFSARKVGPNVYTSPTAQVNASALNWFDIRKRRRRQGEGGRGGGMKRNLSRHCQKSWFAKEFSLGEREGRDRGRGGGRW
jgi:hypothetical protein